MSSSQDRWINYRNKVLANPRFQNFVARFFVTRPVAKSRANALFTVVAGFAYSQILVACIRLDLFTVLRAGPLTVDDIAARIDVPPHAALTLLKAAASLSLTEALRDGRFALGGDGAALLGNPGVAEMIVHHNALYADLADPVALLRRGGGGGALAGYWPYDHPDADAAARYSHLMAASQPMIAEQVLDAVSLSSARALLDVGGGEGAFLAAVAQRWPDLDLTLFDLPQVCERAIGRTGPRTRVVSGSFIDDPLPVGADVISLVRILHDHDDDIAQALLVKVKAVLPARGKLIIAEPMADTRGAEAMGHGYFGMYLFAMGQGRPRTLLELRTMLKYAGFSKAKEVSTRTPLTCRVIVATV